MKLYSLEYTERLKNDKNKLYDMFYPMMKDVKLKDYKYKKYKVREEREMRIDLICLDIYNTTDLIDELMHINGIIDPYSIKKDDIIYYPSSDNLKLIRNKYENNKDLKIESKLKNEQGQEIMTSSPYDGFLPVMVDRDNKEIKITSKLK